MNKELLKLIESLKLDEEIKISGGVAQCRPEKNGY